MSKKKKKYIVKQEQEKLPAPINQPEKTNIGRPSDYEKKVLPYLDKISYWVLLGYTNLDIAKKLDIAESTFYEYLKDFSEFSESVQKNKALANEEVVKATFKSATGHWVEEIVEETSEFFVNSKTTGKQQLYDEYGQPIMQHTIKKTKKYIPPNPTLNKFWLANRDHENWKLKEASTEVNIDNSNTNNTQNNTQVNLNHLSREELKEQLNQLYEIRSNNDSIIQDC